MTALALAAPAFLFPLHFIGRTGFLTIYLLFLAGYLSARFEGGWPKINLSVNLLFAVGAALTLFPSYMFSPIVTTYYKFVFVISIPLMVLSSGKGRFKLKALMNLRIFQYVGRISYSLYLWQQLLNGLLQDAPAWVSLLAMACLMAGCAILFELVEKPLIRWGKQVSAKLQHDSANAAPASLRAG